MDESVGDFKNLYYMGCSRAKTFIRVGVTGAIQDGVQVGDLLYLA